MTRTFSTAGISLFDVSMYITRGAKVLPTPAAQPWEPVGAPAKQQDFVDDEKEILPEKWDGRWWMLRGRALGWEACAEAAKAEATTIAVLSALLLSLSFSVVLFPPTPGSAGGSSSSSGGDDTGGDGGSGFRSLFSPETASRVLTYTAAIAAMLSLSTVVFSTQIIVIMTVCISPGGSL